MNDPRDFCYDLMITNAVSPTDMAIACLRTMTDDQINKMLDEFMFELTENV